MDEAALQSWIGRTEVAIDTVHPGPARALAATLDQDPDRFAQRSELPPLWLWLYFLPVIRASGIGADGHPHRGGFLPPITLPRRMWAGSRVRFSGAVRIGDELTKVSTIAKVSAKTGRTGEMVFVTVRHAYSRGGAELMEEEQDIVYMLIPDVFSPPPPVDVGTCAWTERVAVDPVLLFRFSALTFNSHRIHYDRNYARETERYPGLVVHGPLQAIWLMEAARRWQPGKRPGAFEFRAVRPLFDFDAISVCGQTGEHGGQDLFTANGDGKAGMQARLSWGN
jgi:3-methylfumaryl-CoA hydratase